MNGNFNGDAVFKQNDNEEEEASVQLTKKESVYEMEKDVKKKTNYQELYVMSLMSVIFIVAVISSGMTMGYSAILLPQLKKTNGSLHIDDDMGSWIASLPSIATPFGAILGGFLIDVAGRKLTLQIQTLVAIAGWLCIVFCENHTLLLLGRMILGIALAIGLTAVQIYIAEVSSPRMRGVLGCIPFSSSSFGVLLVFILGSKIHWRVIAGFAIISPAVALFMLFIIPDSPDWLIRKGHIKKARKAFLWLRGNDIMQVEKEMQQLMDKVKHEESHQNQTTSIMALLRTPQVLKPLIIFLFFNLFHLLAGWFILILYAVEIISYMEIENINEYTAAVIYAVVRFIFTIIAVLVVAFIGRRTLGIYTAAGTGLCSFTIAFTLYFNTGKYYVTPLCLFLYVACSTIGFSTLPTILAAEMFPARTRAAAGSIILLASSIITFTYAKLFPFLKTLLGIKGLFLLFGISSILASLVLYATLPESKGRTLLEIEEYFTQDNILWINRNKKRKNTVEEQKETQPINS